VGNNRQSGPRVPQERPDPKAAEHAPGPGAEDRPGFDLGGAVDETDRVGSNIIPGGPKGDPARGSGATGRATGLTDPSGSRSLGNEGDEGSAAGTGVTDGTRGPR
jgi:hypothetical protein